MSDLVTLDLEPLIMAMDESEVQVTITHHHGSESILVGLEETPFEVLLVLTWGEDEWKQRT